MEVTAARQRGCRAKVRYATERRAWAQVRKQREESGQRMTVYRCRFCHHWHLTTRRTV
jgi:hypothetical protein